MENVLTQVPQQSQQEAGSEQKIRCKRCGEKKDRKEFRQVDNPQICLTCYTTQRRSNKQAAEYEDTLSASIGDEQDMDSNKGGKKAKKPRSTIHLSTRAQSILTVLALRRSTSQSEVVEHMLLQRYSEMDEMQKQVVAFVQASSKQ